MPKDLTGKYQDFEIKKANGEYIPADEPVFILRAQDILSPIVVRYYAELLRSTTGDYRHAKELETGADLMRLWPERKLPD